MNKLLLDFINERVQHMKNIVLETNRIITKVKNDCQSKYNLLDIRINKNTSKIITMRSFQSGFNEGTTNRIDETIERINDLEDRLSRIEEK